MKALLRSMRLRTLPLSLGGVLCGGLLAIFFEGKGNNLILLLTALTACSLQVLSNLSNEMGDYRSGVDTSDRQGPAYGLARGMTEKQLWRAINGAVVACGLFGLSMLLTSFHFSILNSQFLILILLGAAAIWAATHYTLGRRPYGYRGLGDLFVFIFFGLVSVVGSYFVLSHRLPISAVPWLAAVGMGLLSIGVLNVNNIRDMSTDQGLRRTVPLRIGEQRAKWYQTALVVLGVGCFFVMPLHPWPMLFTLPFFAWHLVIVWRGSGRRLDPALPLLVLTSCVLAILNAFVCAYSPIR